MSGKMPIPICRILVVIGLLAGSPILYAQAPPPGNAGHLEARLQELEDR